MFRLLVTYLEDGSCHLVFGSEAVIDYESDVKQYRTLVAIYEKDYLGQSNPVIFTINITDVNEAPTITSTTTAFSAAENQTAIPMLLLQQLMLMLMILNLLSLR